MGEATRASHPPVTFANVCETLPRLSNHELKQVQARCLALLGSTSDAEDSESGVSRFYSCIISELSARNIGGQPSLARALKLVNASKFTEACAEVHAFVDRRMASNHPAGLHRGYRVVVGAIADLLARDRVPVSALTVIRHLHRFREGMDWSYPGYCESGLLPILIREKRERL